jgi:hypothetical protein
MTEPTSTEGKFEFRIKPKIEHGMAHVNRAIEELQQIIVSNEDSASKFVGRVKKIESDVGAIQVGTEAFDKKIKELEGEVNRIASLLLDKGIDNA